MLVSRIKVAKAPTGPLMPTILTSITKTRKWEALVNQWRNCTKCPLCHSRTKIVHYRGYVPCDVLFIGEAPGDSEDAIGEPFVGPAGELFDSLWEQANSQMGNPLKVNNPLHGITNVVACRPKTPPTDFTSGELREPTKGEALACQPRLLETIRLANPKLIVTLGKVAQKHCTAEHLGNMVELARVLPLIHPSAILRADPSRQSLMQKRWVLTLADALKELM